MTVAEKQRALIEELSLVDDRHERLGLIVERARRAPALPAACKTDAHRVPGCVSLVWLAGDCDDGRLTLRADADSPMVKALVALLVELYDGATPADALATEPSLFDDLGLNRDLSPTRRNGLAAVRARIKAITAHAVSPHGGR
jgi:cysteine desulfuration protein SufE